MRLRFIAPILVSLCVPFLLFAQTQSDELRAQIRADILKDPRAAQMSQVELDALVNALAEKAEEEGTAEEYLAAQNSFDYSALFSPPEEPSVLARMLTSPLTLAVVALAVILLLVALYIIRRRGNPSEASASNIEA